MLFNNITVNSYFHSAGYTIIIVHKVHVAVSVRLRVSSVPYSLIDRHYCAGKTTGFYSQSEKSTKYEDIMKTTIVMLIFLKLSLFMFLSIQIQTQT